MKIKKIFMSCLLLAGVLSASAQEEYPKTVYDHNPYWYIQLQGGAQYTLGEIDFSDLISPNVQVALGRQFTPVFGARLAVNAWQSKAGIEAGNTTYKWNWKYVAPGIDLTFNLSNLFCGFNPNRIFNFSVFAGAGANIGWDNQINDINAAAAALYPYTIAAGGASENTSYAWDGTKVRMFGRAGIAADFKVSNAVSLGLELNANTLSDRYNSKKAGNWDWYFNALAGLKINLGKTYSTRTIEAPKVPEKVIERVIERVVEKPVPQTVEPTRAVAEKKEVVDTKFRRDIFYLKAGKTWIDKTEQKKVKEVADYMKEHPNCTVEVTGYADVGTGNPTINRNLSQRRAQAVANMLTRNYGIKKDRIKVDYKGDTIQPFAKEIENRVAIAICE
ncbi:MAG: OmpA family protein [Prevotella sp.]|nr:OmpA family protein [Prevotella sp.]